MIRGLSSIFGAARKDGSGWIGQVFRIGWKYSAILTVKLNYVPNKNSSFFLLQILGFDMTNLLIGTDLSDRLSSPVIAKGECYWSSNLFGFKVTDGSVTRIRFLIFIVWFGLVWFYGISTIVGHLIPSLFYTYIQWMISKNILKIIFLNKPELVYFEFS